MYSENKRRAQEVLALQDLAGFFDRLIVAHDFIPNVSSPAVVIRSNKCAELARDERDDPARGWLQTTFGAILSVVPRAQNRCT